MTITPRRITATPRRITATPRRITAALATIAAATLAAAALTAVPAQAAGTEHITNGTFTATLDPWWSTTNVTMSLTNGQLCAKVPAGTTNAWDAMVGVNGISLTKGDKYTAKFDAAASVATTVKANVQLSEDPYTATMSRDTAVPTKAKTFTYTFTSTLDSDFGQFSFQLGGGTKAYTFCIDNVSLISEPGEIDPSGAEQVRNGGFDDGTSGWYSYGTGTPEVTGGRLCSVVPTGLSNVWDGGIGQNDVPLVADSTYTFAFEASASPAATVRASVQLGVDPYTAYAFDSVALTSTAKKFTHTFTAPESVSNAQISFQVGGASSQYTFCVDNVSLRGGA